MDNIFINYSRQGNYEISPIHNGLSDHDAQLISIHDIDFYVQTYNIQNIRKTNKYSLVGFNYNIGLVTEDEICINARGTYLPGYLAATDLIVFFSLHFAIHT